jgi:hypothetical protein
MKTGRVGFIIYEGVSQLDGKTPIVAIATMKTSNAKTGAMVQTWILRRDGNPVENVYTKDDAAICGRCPYRGGNGCYVNVGQAPLAIWRRYKRGGYFPADAAALRSIGEGRKIRMGSYGDPCAVPLSVWKALTRRASGFTGYTHQWSWLKSARPFRRFLMASVDSAEERAAARSQGWRTFRVKPVGAPRERGEVVCPASAESGYRTDCSRCLACNGTDGGRVLDVVIDAHGAKFQRVELYQLGSA